MIVLNQVLIRNSIITNGKRLCISKTYSIFSSSATVRNSPSATKHIRKYSSSPKIAVTECSVNNDQYADAPFSSSSTVKRSINLKVPSKIQDKVGQSASSTDNEYLHNEMPQTPVPSSANEEPQKTVKQPFVYIRDLSLAIDLNKTEKKFKNVALHLPHRRELVELNIDYEDEMIVDNTSPSKAIGSVTERLWRETTLDVKKLPQYYLKLSKARLTALVVITTMAGYGVAPDPFHVGTFLLCTVGTTFTSSAANAVNQYFEIPFDSQMNRTKNRVLVRNYLSPLHAATFAVISGSLGLTILAVGVNPLTAALGAFNLGLYTLVYTPMKRYSIANTWVGSIVGAIPPMMGWTACTGMLEPGAWLLGAIMYAWQFPHFNALSWNLRPDYSRGGYRMASVVRPQLCKRVALRYSAGMIFLCAASPLADLTTWTFVVDSLPLNIYMTYLAWNFYRKGDSNSSRKLFRFTLVYIPLLLVLMFISKKGTRDNQFEMLKAKVLSRDSVT